MYVDRGFRVCRPGDYESISQGDSIIVNPALLKVNGRTVVYPPLSRLTLTKGECDIVESPAWADAYTISGRERIEAGSGNVKKVEGELRVEEPKFVPGYTFVKLVPQFEGLVYESCDGIPLVTVSGMPLLTISKGLVRVCAERPNVLLLALAYSAFYYL